MTTSALSTGRAAARWPNIGSSAFVVIACVLGFRSLLTAQEQHPGEYSPAAVESGSRLYSSQCATCHAATGDGVGGIDLRRGTFRRVASDADLRRVIVEGVPGTAMRRFNFTTVEQNSIVAFIRSGLDVRARAVKVGDASRGKTVFETKGGCGRCHRTAGAGPRSAPDLTDIGALRSPTLLQEAILDPTPTMLPINRPIRAVTKDGTVIEGRRLNEDTYTVQLIDSRERLLSLVKADLKDYEVLTTSRMPSYKDTLTADEIADLVAYLLTLRG